MNPSFSETQKFNKWWHYLLAGLPLFIAVCFYLGILLDFLPLKGEQKKGALLITLIFSLGLACLFFLWFYLLKLNTHINQDGINVSFYGIPFAKRRILWSDIQSISVVKYSPFTDYGGWGVRYSASGNGWCYNISGNYGIKLVQTNGKPFLIGTQQKEEAEKIIHHYFNK